MICKLLVRAFGRPTHAEITLHHQDVATPDVISILEKCTTFCSTGALTGQLASYCYVVVMKIHVCYAIVMKVHEIIMWYYNIESKIVINVT